MEMLKTVFIIIVIVGLLACKEQNLLVPEQGQKMEMVQRSKDYREVFSQLKTNDSLLFELGFNGCDTSQVSLLTSDNFEFYHDQSGITTSKKAFVQSISGLCQLTYKPTRVLDKNSLTIHLLRNNGKIYGAIQSGKHKFYGEEENRPKYLTSTADFIHLWIIEEGSWKLKRVLSYNHQEP